ncbi:acyl-CoA dehydrogenase [Azorhizobium oxalatiphilum]|uniref:Dibenzothiophene monooxygenase n=1 Tax=Azorhizobium oxalatiphilum TaxID=980631 RepID=A0A917BTP3_9HYPH|nr:acyl-CoA dehydrogenase family protein [Azorhizobium oxalatiphilum]GGF58463.1 acyl-CoA dehydrogenase [Azorhizobium oxalatiphilum]
MNIATPGFPASSQLPLAPGAQALDDLLDTLRDNSLPQDRDVEATQAAIAAIRRAGLGAFRLPRAEGGGGATLPQLFGLVLRLAEADSNLPHILRNHFAFVERALRTQDNAKYRGWLDDARAGRLFGLGASELGIQNIGAGGGETLLTPHGDGFRLSGSKYYSTGNFYSDFIVVNAQTPEGRRVNAVVPTDRDGVTIAQDWDGIGQRQTASGATRFDDVPVRPEEVIDIAAEDRRLPYDATFPQLYLTTIIAGILRAVVRDASALVLGRGRNFYHATAARPAEDPLLQQALGRLASVAYVAEASVQRAAEALAAAYDSVTAGTPDEALFLRASLEAAQAKVIVDELALGASNQLFELGGASAATQRQRLDRHWRNIRTIASHNPVSYKARAIGQHVLDGTPLPNAAYF